LHRQRCGTDLAALLRRKFRLRIVHADLSDKHHLVALECIVLDDLLRPVDGRRPFAPRVVAGKDDMIVVVSKITFVEENTGAARLVVRPVDG
jgi:hypothetical protein